MRKYFPILILLAALISGCGSRQPRSNQAYYTTSTSTYSYSYQYCGGEYKFCGKWVTDTDYHYYTIYKKVGLKTIK